MFSLSLKKKISVIRIQTFEMAWMFYYAPLSSAPLWMRTLLKLVHSTFPFKYTKWMRLTRTNAILMQYKCNSNAHKYWYAQCLRPTHHIYSYSSLQLQISLRISRGTWYNYQYCRWKSHRWSFLEKFDNLKKILAVPIALQNYVYQSFFSKWRRLCLWSCLRPMIKYVRSAFIRLD